MALRIADVRMSPFAIVHVTHETWPVESAGVSVSADDESASGRDGGAESLAPWLGAAKR